MKLSDLSDNTFLRKKMFFFCLFVKKTEKVKNVQLPYLKFPSLKLPVYLKWPKVVIITFHCVIIPNPGYEPLKQV